MVMGLESFMESYNRNVVIHGSDEDYATMFEGVEPCTYEEAIETFFEAQYSVEAMAAITENAIVMESAGAATVVNEGIVGGFISTAWEKIKECVTKVKQFAVACVKKIIQFFKDLYAKATPIDKAMQMYGKNGIDYSDIKTAMANGFKIRGSLKLLNAESELEIYRFLEEFDTRKTFGGNVGVEWGQKEVEDAAMRLLADIESKSAEECKKQANDVKESLMGLKEKDKERFTWVGQLLSDTNIKGDLKKKLIITANSDTSKDGDITDKQWEVIKDFALNGQRKQRDYKSSVEATAKAAIKNIENIQKAINKYTTSGIKDAKNDNERTKAGEYKANVNTVITPTVAFCTYSANRSVMVMNKVIIPVMRKLHITAIGTYLYITANTKAKNRKTDKALKIK